MAQCNNALNALDGQLSVCADKINKSIKSKTTFFTCLSKRGPTRRPEASSYALQIKLVPNSGFLERGGKNRHRITKTLIGIELLNDLNSKVSSRFFFPRIKKNTKAEILCNMFHVCLRNY